MKIRKILVGALLIFSVANVANGSDSGSDKMRVQTAMKNYVNSHVSAGFFPLVYKGQVLKLKVAKSTKYPDGFHSGVKKNGQLYTSCADFVEVATGKKYDIDFLVNKVGEKYVVVQPIVHSIAGVKNPYDLEH